MIVLDHREITQTRPRTPQQGFSACSRDIASALRTRAEWEQLSKERFGFDF